MSTFMSISHAIGTYILDRNIVSNILKNIVCMRKVPTELVHEISSCHDYHSPILFLIHVSEITFEKKTWHLVTFLKLYMLNN